MRLVLSGACPPDRSGEVPRLAEAFGLRESCASRSKQRHSIDGSLEISASEQADFEESLSPEVAVQRLSYTTLREIMLPKETPIFRYTAKNRMGGVCGAAGRLVCRLSGTHDDVWFFALNMDIRSETDLPLRKQLVREALVAKGIIRQDGTIKPEK